MPKVHRVGADGSTLYIEMSSNCSNQTTNQSRRVFTAKSFMSSSSFLSCDERSQAHQSLGTSFNLKLEQVAKSNVTTTTTTTTTL